MKLASLLALAVLAASAIWYLSDESKESLASNNFTKNYVRVVSMAPSFCETVVALKQGHRLVGTTIHCKEESVSHLEKIGSFAQANFEAIVALKPDLVLAVPHVMSANILKKLRQNKIEVYDHKADSLQDIQDIISELSAKFNATAIGNELNSKIQNELRDARSSILSIQLTSQLKKTLIAISHIPFVVAGKNTFPSQIIEMIGLENIVSSNQSTWPIWPLENLLLTPPKIFIVSEGEEHWEKYESLLDSLGLDLLAKNIKFIIPKRTLFSSPSPSIIEDTKYLVKLISSSI